MNIPTLLSLTIPLQSQQLVWDYIHEEFGDYVGRGENDPSFEERVLYTDSPTYFGLAAQNPYIRQIWTLQEKYKNAGYKISDCIQLKYLGKEGRLRKYLNSNMHSPVRLLFFEN